MAESGRYGAQQGMPISDDPAIRALQHAYNDAADDVEDVERRTLDDIKRGLRAQAELDVALATLAGLVGGITALEQRGSQTEVQD